METESPRYRIALDDFRHARRKAAMQEILGRLTGQSTALLSFEEARQRLKASGEEVHGLQEIPLKAIIGSVGRYADFNRNFLPKRNVQSRRWAKVKSVLRDLDDMPPIQVYQIGEAYFVLDGNHRVSIARERGLEKMRAYVTEIHTKVPLSPETDPNDFILKTEYAEFLANTSIDESCPQADLNITAPGRYKILEKHINHHRQQIMEESNKEISEKEAARHWYSEIYLPVIKVIRSRGILRGFPKRTETDLYVWIAEHQEKLQKNLGWSVDVDVAAADLVDQRGEGIKRSLMRFAEKIYTAIIPPILKPGPQPGKWRERQLATHDMGNLFTHILVPFNGKEQSWQALEQAIRVAWRENSHLMGLHIVSDESERESDFAKGLAEQFEARCQEAGLIGEFAVDVGGIASTISTRARWSDLVVLYMAHPPESQITSRISSGIRSLIQRCPRPILTVHPESRKLERFLVAYDGSPKANEALYMATYLAGHWEASLVVLTVSEDGKTLPWAAFRAKRYLDSHNIDADFIQKEGKVGESILEAVDEENVDMILMGGYSRKPVAEVILGSSLDVVLRNAQHPVFICR
ncbi:MAG: universal stress protein [Chloroflexi bacterium]|nr:universal stress protein [Chloroflexota bacterium]